MIKPQTVVRCSWQGTFGTLTDKFDGVYTIEKIQISSTEKFVGHVHILPIDALVILCEQFKCFNVCITVESTQPHVSTMEWNALEVIMLALCEWFYQKAKNYEELSSCIMIFLVSLTLPGKATDLEQRLSSLPLYQPLFVNDIAPEDQFG